MDVPEETRCRFMRAFGDVLLDIDEPVVDYLCGLVQECSIAQTTEADDQVATYFRELAGIELSLEETQQRLQIVENGTPDQQPTAPSPGLTLGGASILGLNHTAASFVPGGSSSAIPGGAWSMGSLQTGLEESTQGNAQHWLQGPSSPLGPGWEESQPDDALIERGAQAEGLYLAGEYPDESEEEVGQWMLDETGQWYWLPAYPYQEDPLDPEAEEEESVFALSVLSQEFPEYDLDSLSAVYAANGSDLMMTLDALMSTSQLLEEPEVAKAPEPPPVLDSLNFPSLSEVSSRGGRESDQALGPQNTSVEEERAQAAAGHASHGVDFRAAVQTKAAPVARSVGTGGPWDEGRTARQAGEWQSASPASYTGWTAEQVQQQQARQQQVAARWVATGVEVERMYHEAREQASDHARVRNQYFQQATSAFLAGNKALAKDLAHKGRWHAEQMKNAHAAASEAIYHSRNAAQDPATGRAGGAHTGGRDGGVPLLDLHGLHVKEAVEILRRKLMDWRDGRMAHRHVHVLVGTGHHTRGSRTPARLPRAVEEYLQSENVQYTQPQPGLLQVHL
ncbi:hypothetical protein CYMTET_6182 [Cymbomonas tetramitiformis]|uniref:Smr domain-containing protein n=1 Tax=Cymbomonas tetramitiformis TaxID=36881 RepID=A0AAE0GXP3_9CHLO|nr:hypothetical protein CYMTET_6182 [Cymbomonas tetramitiformis]